MEELYKSYDELPIMLSVPELAVVLGISRAGAYDLTRRADFPSFKIWTRILVPKEKLKMWVEEQIQNDDKT